MNQTVKSISLLCLILSSTANFSVMAKNNDSHMSKNIIGVFAGLSFVEDSHGDRKSEATYGIEYEYRFHNNWSAGLTYETMPDAHHTMVMVLM